MGCCGKLNKLASIAQGNLATVMQAINLLPPERYLYHPVRLDACRQCEHHTYLTEFEYLRWVNENGGTAKYASDIDALEPWAPLPIREERLGTKLFCSVCKCWLEAKAYVKQENCPLGNPAWRKPREFFKDTL
jgi:hypothetical protein